VYPHEVYPLLRTCVDDEYDDDDEITPADAADLLSTFWSTHAPRGNSLHVEVKFLEFLQQRLACQRIQAWLVEQQSIVAQHELALRAKDKQWAPTVPPAADHDGAAVKGALLPPAPPILQAPAPAFACAASEVARMIYGHVAEEVGLGADGTSHNAKVLTSLAKHVADVLVKLGGIHAGVGGEWAEGGEEKEDEDEGEDGDEDGEDGDEDGEGGSGGGCSSSTSPVGLAAGSTRTAAKSPGSEAFTQTQPSQQGSEVGHDAMMGDALVAIGKKEHNHELSISTTVAMWGFRAAPAARGKKGGGGGGERSRSSHGSIPSARVGVSADTKDGGNGLLSLVDELVFAPGAPLGDVAREVMFSTKRGEPVVTEINTRFVHDLAVPFLLLVDELFSRLRVTEPEFLLYVHAPMKAFIKRHIIAMHPGLAAEAFVGTESRFKVMESKLGQRFVAEAVQTTDVIAEYPGARVPPQLVFEVALSSGPLTDVLKKRYGDALNKVRAVYMCDGNLVGNSVLLGDFATCAYWVKFLGTGHLAPWRRLPMLIALTPGGDGHADLLLHEAKSTKAAASLQTFKGVVSPHAKDQRTDVEVVMYGGDGKWYQEVVAARPYNDPGGHTTPWSSLQRRLRQLLDPGTHAPLLINGMTHTQSLFDSIAWDTPLDYIFRDEHGFLLKKAPVFRKGVEKLYWDILHLVITPAKRLLGDTGRFLLRRYSEPVVRRFIARLVAKFGIHCWAGIEGNWVSFGCKRAGRAGGLALHVSEDDGGLLGEPGEVLPKDDPEAPAVIKGINFIFSLFAKTSRTMLTLDFDEFKTGCKTFQLDSTALNAAVMVFFGERNMTPALSYRCDVLPYYFKMCTEWEITARELAMDGAEESHKLRTEMFDMMGRFTTVGRKDDFEAQRRTGYFHSMLRVMIKSAHDFIMRVETTPGKTSLDVFELAAKRDEYLRRKTGGSIYFSAMLRHVLKASGETSTSAAAAASATSLPGGSSSSSSSATAAAVSTGLAGDAIDVDALEAGLVNLVADEAMDAAMTDIDGGNSDVEDDDDDSDNDDEIDPATMGEGKHAFSSDDDAGEGDNAGEGDDDDDAGGDGGGGGGRESGARRSTAGSGAPSSSATAIPRIHPTVRSKVLKGLGPEAMGNASRPPNTSMEVKTVEWGALNATTTPVAAETGRKKGGKKGGKTGGKTGGKKDATPVLPPPRVIVKLAFKYRTGKKGTFVITIEDEAKIRAKEAGGRLQLKILSNTVIAFNIDADRRRDTTFTMNVGVAPIQQKAEYTGSSARGTLTDVPAPGLIETCESAGWRDELKVGTPVEVQFEEHGVWTKAIVAKVNGKAKRGEGLTVTETNPSSTTSSSSSSSSSSNLRSATFGVTNTRVRAPLIVAPQLRITMSAAQTTQLRAFLAQSFRYYGEAFSSLETVLAPAAMSAWRPSVGQAGDDEDDPWFPPASRRPFGPVNDALQTIRTWHTAGCKDDSSAVPIRYDPSTGRPATIHPWRDYPDGVPVYADVNDVSSEFCLVEVQGADKDQRLKQARVHWSLRSFVATRPQPKTIVDQIAAAQKNAARGTMGGARAGSTRAS
jgi:hypothetical protein